MEGRTNEKGRKERRNENGRKERRNEKWKERKKEGIMKKEGTKEK